jgi:histidine triad (HIT) family protein
MENSCTFCKIIKNELLAYKVWENKNFLAFLDKSPVNPGHLMIIPKRHVDYFFDLNDAEYKEIMDIAKKIQKSLLKATGAKRIGIVVEGFAVPHVHLHLVPLHKGNDTDPCRAKKGVPEELDEMAKQIRNLINEDK